MRASSCYPMCRCNVSIYVYVYVRPKLIHATRINITLEIVWLYITILSINKRGTRLRQKLAMPETESWCIAAVSPTLTLFLVGVKKKQSKSKYHLDISP